ncbi:MAG: excinuclease ABC subunit UvrB [Paludisphaera borealis]|uniref:excinuclease ABC subunit UvrB n=1 Tax=Paludisphaera borealis TaxID=1387353 RepID=UPI00283F0B56|nr:excinuclease ABC subunit UvrB [Paludisphaera borealis]MDR3619848.1 excinuclease ABC subunit UvrB [Paludisphaera borealis]
MSEYQLVSPYQPAGDQPQAIDELVKGLADGRASQTLMGVTGSGKTFTMANVIAQYGKPALVMSHNKTLAAQLYAEFKEFFPHNAVRYFVSYYDYYQPEAYIPQRDIYIEKDASINEEIERLRLASTSALVSRQDVIVVASVSCIYGLGSPDDYRKMMVRLKVGDFVDRDELLLKFVDIQYDRNDVSFERGKFRVRGDVIELWPAYEEFGFRIELFGDEVERLATIDGLTGSVLETHQDLYVYPAKHFVLPEERIQGAVAAIGGELDERLQTLKEQGKLLEAQRLAARTRYDMEMLLEVGYCSGIENYSRHLSGRKAGETPNTLLDFFPPDSLLILDESHVSLPQIRGMFAGDHSRKLTLVEHGFRLPSALDNRPLRIDEWESKPARRLFVSATPGDYEVTMSGGEVVEQVIRPTGLIDPVVRVEPARGQVPALLEEAKKRAAKNERVLVTTLTKRLAEDLTRYLKEQGLRCKWLHSELDAIERMTILRELREGAFDVLVGVNLLREGLDLPEVSMVCILDADKEGFLRSETSLIQTIGRSARHVNAEVVLYADRITNSMQRAMDETERRRVLQTAYNAEHGITPESVVKAIRRGIEEEIQARTVAREAVGRDEATDATEEYLDALEGEMLDAAEKLEFERAAALRDKIQQLRAAQGGGSARPAPSPQGQSAKAKAKAKARAGKKRG